MAEYMYANIVRGGTVVIARNLFIHFSKLDMKEAAEYQGVDPAFTYRMDTRFLPCVPVQDVTTVQQGDHVIDTQVIDPKTGALRAFLIVSDPSPKVLLMSWQWTAMKLRGV